MPPTVPSAQAVPNPEKNARGATSGGPSRFEAAAAVLEKAAQSASADPNVLYLLFLAYKRQGKVTEARNALRKVQKPDANVILQMGLLSLEENHLAQAEEEFARAWSLDPNSFEICYNLLLTQLTLGKADDCLELTPRAIELLDQRGSPGGHLVEDRRFLQVLGALLRTCQKGSNRPDPLLAELTPNDEQRLLKVVR